MSSQIGSRPEARLFIRSMKVPFLRDTLYNEKLNARHSFAFPQVQVEMRRSRIELGSVY